MARLRRRALRIVGTAQGVRFGRVEQPRVCSSRRGARDIEHIGSAHDGAELALLRAVARQRLAAGQDELDLGLERIEPAEPAGAALPITSSRMGHLWDALTHALADTQELRNLIKEELIKDILVVITYSGRAPDWLA